MWMPGCRRRVAVSSRGVDAYVIRRRLAVVLGGTIPASLFISGRRWGCGERVDGAARGAVVVPPMSLRCRPHGPRRTDQSRPRWRGSADRGHSAVWSSGQRRVQRARNGSFAHLQRRRRLQSDSASLAGNALWRKLRWT